MSKVTDITQRYDPWGNQAYSTANNPWASFFGTPAHPYKTSSYDKYDRHNYNLPEAYVGKNITLQQTVDEMIYTDETWYTSVALPYNFTDQLGVQYDKWEFNEHFTDIVPEQGVSRLVSSHRETREAKFVRRGLAASFEHGFMETPEGRAHYVLTLRQIARAVQETTNFGVIYAYLTAHNYNREWEAKHGYYRKQTLADLLDRDKFMFAIAQKEKFGMEKLDAQIVEWMNRYHADADMWILPPQLTIYLRLVPVEKTDYNISGPMGPDRVNGIGAGRPQISNDTSKRIHDVVEPYALLAKNKVYISRTYHVDRTGPIDLLTEQAQIGEYNLMCDRGDECGYDNYNSCFRTIRIYDEDNDRGQNITLEWALENCMLFDESGNLRPLNTGRQTINTQDILSDFLSRPVKNERTGEVEAAPVTHFGDINSQFMSTKSIGHLANSVINAIYPDKSQRDTAMQQIGNGMRYIQQMNMAQFPANANILDAAIGNDPVRRATVAGYGSTAGMTSWDAINELANNQGGDIGAAMTGLIRAVRTMARRLVGIMGTDNIFLEPGNALPNTADRTAAAVLYENLLNHHAVPVFATGGGANIGQGDAAAQEAVDTLRGALLNPGSVDDQAILTQRKIPFGQNTEVENNFNAADSANLNNNPEAVADLLRTNWKFTRSTSKLKLDNWIKEVLENYNESAQLREGLNNPQASNFDYQPTTLMAYPENPTFKAAANRRGNVPAGPWELASKFDLTKARDNRGYGGNVGGQNYKVISIGDDIGSNWNLNELPTMIGVQASQNIQRQNDQSQRRTRDRRAGYRDQSYRSRGGSGFASIGAMHQFNSNQVLEEATWIPEAGGQLGLRAGQDINLRIGTMAYNLEKISRSAMSGLNKLAAAVYIGARVRKSVFESFIANHIVFPMNFILARPHARYQMAIGIKTKAGASTGQTFFGHSNFMLSDDATVKMHYGHYTHYGKSVVTKEENVFIAKRIYSSKCEGGLGCVPYVSREQYQPSNNIYNGDIFVFAIPFEKRQLPNPFDISGRFYSYMDRGFVDNSDPSSTTLHYPTATRYNSMWGFYNPASVVDDLDEPLFRSEVSQVNRIVYQGAQGNYNPVDRKFSDVIKNTGHWGQSVYSGCKDVRNGKLTYLEKLPLFVLGF